MIGKEVSEQNIGSNADLNTEDEQADALDMAEQILISRNSPQSIEQIAGRLNDPDADRRYNAQKVLDMLESAEHYITAPIGPYLPFEASLELSKLKSGMHKAGAQQNKAAKQIVREQLHEFSEIMALQNSASAELVGELVAAVREKPDVTRGELFARVIDCAEVCRFPYSVLRSFVDGIEGYCKKHQAVEKAYAEYGADRLFEACFGKPPVGKVEVIKGPMTLHFRTFDRADYSLAYNFNTRKPEEALDRSSALYQKAQSSGGAALRSTLLIELAGCITIGNESSYFHSGFSEEITKFESGQQDFMLFPERDDVDVRITIEGVGEWEVKSELEDDEVNVSISLLDAEKIEENPIFHVKLPCGVSSLESSEPRAVGELKVDGKVVGVVSLSPYFFRVSISNSSGKEMTVRHYDYSGENRWDESASNAVYLHEEQHQMNKLFAPFRPMVMPVSPNEAEVLRPEERLAFIRRFFQAQRRIDGVDTRARDEIIAHYRGGDWTSEQIIEHLTSLKNYDFFKTEDLSTSRILVKLEGSIRLRRLDIEGIENEYSYALEQINSILRQNGESYKRDVAEWVSSIVIMEGKGYNRDEVCNILYSLPISVWLTEAKRLPANKAHLDAGKMRRTSGGDS